MVVGPHGAGLANLVFCRPGTKVVEIFSNRFVNLEYWALSCMARLDYYYQMSVGPRPDDDGDYFKSWDWTDDIECDLAVLEQTIRHVTRASR